MIDTPPTPPEPPSGSPPSAATGASQPVTPPGWYVDATGTTRWWDGTQWGQAAPAQPPVVAGGSVDSERGTAVLAQVLGLIGLVATRFGWVGPLVVYLTAKPHQAFVRHHAAESLNFQLTLLIAWVASFVLMLVLIGFVTAAIVWIVSLILPILAAVAANRGEWYRYPLSIRFVSGAAG